MWINAKGKISEVDARPSDAVTLALRAGAPIFITTEAFEQAGAYVLTVDQEFPELEGIHQKLDRRRQSRTGCRRNGMATGAIASTRRDAVGEDSSLMGR